MRPGSPVRSPAQQVRMANFLWDRKPEVAAPKPSATVWVALATYTRAVAVNNKINTAPISGGPQGIFSRPGPAMTEQVVAAAVIAVCPTQTEAETAVAGHRSQNETLQAEYTVTEHAVGAPEPAPPRNVAPETYPCIGGCGKTLSGGISWCDPCRQKHWASATYKGED